ncbi:WD40 repeat domain-containing protein [Paludisphaera borealis]|uniref:Uncharacterized protein n=1 Tax=Paludisphaera borealis TaxID=1387353 RepID=A0A1U7CRU6_9BACT|nr:WD40 repeat domain-containing protein [Paludisphaera borealis]APW61616.1 hypothetical protein BSF38_03138 [Paludisphaera borealis]
MALTMEAKPLRGGLARHSDVVTSVAFSPDGGTLVSGGWDGQIKLWDLRTGPAGMKLERVLRGVWDEVEAVAFSPDGSLVAGLGTGWDGEPFGAVTLWNREGGRGRRLLRTPGKVDAMAFSPDGLTLATAGGEGRTVTLWNAVTGAERMRLPEHSAPVWSVEFSRDGTMLAAGSGVVPAMVDPAIEDRIGEVKIWDLTGAEPTPRVRLIGHEYGTAAVTFSPDGATVASGGFDRGVKLWDVARGVPRAEPEGHKGWVAALAFSPDGSLLATGSHDQTVRLWDAVDGRPRAILRGHTGNVYSVAFSPDGRLLASGSLDGAVRLWDVDQSMGTGLDL